MDPGFPPYDQNAQSLNSDARWRELYPILQTLTRHLVFSFTVPVWRGQEYDIAEDIMQETAHRLLEYSQKAEQGERAPIRSIEQLMIVIARNKCKDFRRKDRRFVRVASDEAHTVLCEAQHDHFPLLDQAVANVDQEAHFKVIAQVVASFPTKQRKALLMDLANRMHFDARPTPLQKAFLAAGICLQDYQQPLSANSRERARHASLVCHAYKKIALLCGARDKSEW